jgi:hypothetical protein
MDDIVSLNSAVVIAGNSVADFLQLIAERRYFAQLLRHPLHGGEAFGGGRENQQQEDAKGSGEPEAARGEALADAKLS